MARTMKDDRKAVVIEQFADGSIAVRVDVELESDGISGWYHFVPGEPHPLDPSIIIPALNQGQINSAKGFLGQMVAKIVA